MCRHPHLLLVEGLAVVVQNGAELQAGVGGALVKTVVQSHADGRQFISKLLLLLEREKGKKKDRKNVKEKKERIRNTSKSHSTGS